MIDTSPFKAEADAWGMPLGERFELETIIRPSFKPLKDFEQEDHEELAFRRAVADVLIANGLDSKAKRYLACDRKGRIYRCEGPEHHEYFVPEGCDLRFCPRCGARQFARLFNKHSPVLDWVQSHAKRGFALREITLTTENLGEIDHDQIIQFHAHVKETLKTLMKGVDGWGMLIVDEVGFNNTNLHAHILFYGPYVSQARIAEVSKKISGSQVVWITLAEGRGPEALRYMLKYVSKPPSDNPEMIGQLEVAFHGTRRVHAMGIFYNFKAPEHDCREDLGLACPKCGARLVADPGGLREVSYLKDIGFESLRSARIQGRNKTWVN
jgi:hypothetical protein